MQRLSVRLVFKSGHVEDLVVEDWVTRKDIRGGVSGVDIRTLPNEAQIQHIDLSEVVLIITRDITKPWPRDTLSQ